MFHHQAHSEHDDHDHLEAYDSGRRRVVLRAATPWDFVKAHGPGPFAGEVFTTKHNGNMWVIQLAAPFTDHKHAYGYIVATPKEISTPLKRVWEAKKTVPCEAHFLNQQHLSSEEFWTFQFREVPSFVGTIESA